MKGPMKILFLVLTLTSLSGCRTLLNQPTSQVATGSSRNDLNQENYNIQPQNTVIIRKEASPISLEDLRATVLVDVMDQLLRLQNLKLYLSSELALSGDQRLAFNYPLFDTASFKSVRLAYASSFLKLPEALREKLQYFYFTLDEINANLSNRSSQTILPTTNSAERVRQIDSIMLGFWQEATKNDPSAELK